MDFDAPLNVFYDNIFANRLDRKSVDTNSTRYDMRQRVANDQFRIDYLDGSTIYKAIVLHVYEDGEDPGFWAQAEALVNRIANRGKYLRIRARIPELHAHIPVPCTPGSDNQKNRAKIEMHPLFVSNKDGVQGPINVGDIVRVSFSKGPKYGLQAGGILHEKYASGDGGVSAAPGTTNCASLVGRFDPNRVDHVQQLGNTFPDEEGEQDRIAEAAATTPVQTEATARAQLSEQDPEKMDAIQEAFVYGPTEIPAEINSEFGARCPPCTKWKRGRGPGSTVTEQDGSTRAGGNYYLDCKDHGSATHGGVDLAVLTGTAVRAPFVGKVLFAGNSGGGSGTMVSIGYREGDSGAWVYVVDYLHLSAIAADIQAGTDIAPGDHLGNSGQSGNVSGPHLHIAVKHNSARVNPRDYFPVGSFSNSRPGGRSRAYLTDPDRQLNPTCESRWGAQPTPEGG